MGNIVKNLKDHRCNNCGTIYQALHAYIHPVLGKVCIYCMDAAVTDSKWA